MHTIIKVIIVDDHRMFIEGIISLLDNNPDIEILGTAADGKAGIKLLEKEKPNVVLTDVEMPKVDGITFTKYIKNHHPDIKVIALTSHCNGTIIDKLKSANVDGYLLKKTGKIELLNAIYRVVSGHTYFTKEAVEELKNSLLKAEGKNNDVTLSPRELEVLKLICYEKNTATISEELHISINTVESHRKNLMRKLGVKNMIGLVKYAIKEHIV
ncbi:response regulator [Aquimarina brevivitae]|uniref:LuxR family two component transcriptional regulator n=1 Tax=Aquimarina brevivitae TaxID=323412 RepID=A0A4Q7P159_9FLAO|nr:response regulator transcription factor [Aquimarina brevivitae]RZS93445.1 LuxR family two component transcriptional regulator [Aquimarina brevivitae]